MASTKKPWHGSNRRARLPKKWPQIVVRILNRDPTCQVCGLRPSSQVDHIRPGDDHRDRNLQGICSLCHGLKSAREGSRAAGFHGRKRPVENHPGLMG